MLSDNTRADVCFAISCISEVISDICLKIRYNQSHNMTLEERNETLKELALYTWQANDLAKTLVYEDMWKDMGLSEKDFGFER